MLDLDDITGTGPETITIAAPAPSVYAVVVHDFETNVNNDPNLVTVRVYLSGETTPHEFTVTLTGEGSMVYVANIDTQFEEVTACEPGGC